MADLVQEYTKPVIEIAPDSDDEMAASAAATAKAADDVTGVSVWQTLLTENPSVSKFSGIKRQARQRQSDVEHRLDKAFAVEHRMQEAVRARKTYSDVRRIVAHSNIVTSVTPDVTNDLRVSYREQGNLDMYTASNMKKREGNRHHPEIIGALDTFWNVLPKLATGKLNKQIYVWMCRKMYFKLVRNANEEEFQAVVQEDWRTDAVFGNTMNIRMFRQAIFSMADVWCETVDPREYRDFIHGLQKCVEHGATYKGSLEDPTGEEKQAQAASRRRRNSRMPSVDEMPVQVGGTAVKAARALEGDMHAGGDYDKDLVALLADEEELIVDVYESASQAAAAMLHALFDHGTSLETVTEDVLLLRAGLTHEKQMKLFGEASTMTKQTLEERLIDDTKERETRREHRREAMQARVAIADAEQENAEVRGGNHVTRLAARAKIHEETMGAHRSLFHTLRDAIFRSGRQFSDVRHELEKLEKQRLEVKKSVHLDPYDVEHGHYIDFRQNWTLLDFSFARNVDTFLYEDAIQFNHDLEQTRKLLEVLSFDSLPRTIEEHAVDEDMSHFQREEEDKMGFGTQRWVAVCECFERGHMRRNEWSGGIIDSLREVVKKVQDFELSAMKRIVEGERALDKKMIEAVENDKTIVGKHREDSIADIKKAYEERKMQRDGRVLALKAMHEEMDQELSDLVADHDDLVRLQREMVELWKKAETMEQLQDATVAYVEVLEAGKMVSTLANTVMSRPSTNLNISAGGSASLPEDVRKPIDLAILLDKTETEWFGFHTERLLSERVRFNMGAYQRHQKRHLDGLSFLAAQKVAFRLRRVGDCDEYPKLGKDQLGLLEREIVKKRLEKVGEYKDELKKTLSWRDEAIHEAEQLVMAEARSLHETRVVVSRIFEVERTYRDRHIALISKWTRLAQYKRTLDRAKLRRAERVCLDEEGTSELERRKSDVRKGKNEEKKLRMEKVKVEEAAKREAARLRQEELEARKRDAAKRERNIKAQEQRRKLLEEQERRQKERLRKEKEEKERWHREFLEQEKQSKREEAERKAWSDFKKGQNLEAKGTGDRPTSRRSSGVALEPGGLRVRRASDARRSSASNDAMAAAAAAATAAAAEKEKEKEKEAEEKKALKPTGKVVRRKSVDASAAAKPAAKKAAQPKKAEPSKPKKPTKEERKTIAEYKPMENIPELRESSPHSTMKLKLSQMGDLNTSSAARELKSFADRRSYYIAEHMSNRGIYMNRCKAAGVTPDTELLQALSTEPLLFDMTTMTLSNRPIPIGTVSDLIMFNPVQRLYLRKADLDDESVKALCETLAQDGFISYLDIRNNPKVSDMGASYVLALAKNNSRLVRAEVDGTGVKEETRRDIKMTCDNNRDCREMGRAEFNYIHQVFRDMDTDGSGIVTLDELRDFARREQERRAQQAVEASRSGSSKLASPPKLAKQASTIEQMAATLEHRVDMVRDHLCAMADKEGTGDFTLADLICFVYPHWTTQDAETIVTRYSDDAGDGVSLTEMQEFIDTFGSNGCLSLNQLATGLGESPDALRTVFGEFDVDNDGRLSLEEFMRFMSA